MSQFFSSTTFSRVPGKWDSPARPLLVKARGGATIPIKQISNTSVSEADVDLLVTVAEHLSMLHLLRQEIFFLEGRRMSDLGIRLPVPTRELETNPTMSGKSIRGSESRVNG